MNRIGLMIALVIGATVGLIFGIWPELDIKLASPFFDPARGGFWRSYDPIYLRARDAAVWLITLIALPAAIAPIVKLFRPQRPLLIPGRAVLLMLIPLALAPGVLANLGLKEHWSRPRPIDIAEFGGDEHFRAWWDPRGDCPKNCSFIAGEPAGAFWTLAPAAVLPPQWRAVGYAAALVFGAAVGAQRMAAGAHFFSDVAFAGIFTFLIIWLTYAWLYRWRPTRITDAMVEQLLQRMPQALRMR